MIRYRLSKQSLVLFTEDAAGLVNFGQRECGKGFSRFSWLCYVIFDRSSRHEIVVLLQIAANRTKNWRVGFRDIQYLVEMSGTLADITRLCE